MARYDALTDFPGPLEVQDLVADCIIHHGVGQPSLMKGMVDVQGLPADLASQSQRKNAAFENMIRGRQWPESKRTKVPGLGTCLGLTCRSRDASLPHINDFSYTNLDLVQSLKLNDKAGKLPWIFLDQHPSKC